MATKVTKYVNTDTGSDSNNGDSGSPWASMSGAKTWLAANKPNLTALDEWVEVNFSGTTADTTSVEWQGITTDSTRYVILQAGAGQSATAAGWKTDRYRMETTGRALRCGYGVRVYLKNLQIKAANGMNNDINAIDLGQVYTTVRHITGCYIWLATSGSVSNVGVLGISAGTYYINNCVLRATGTRDASLLVVNSGDIFVGIINNTLVGGSRYGMNFNYGGYNPSIVKNNIVKSGGTDFYGTYTNITLSYNASADATASGTGSRTSQTFTFLDEANGDFRLAATDAGARDYGADASSDTQWVVGSSTDIDGNVRSGTWDIGAHEYVTAGPSRTIQEHLAQRGF